MDVLGSTALIAPEVDQLVWAVRPAIPAGAIEHLNDHARMAGLASLGLLPNLSEFFLDIGISTDLAQTRMAYADPDDVADRLLDLVEAGVIAGTPSNWRATEDGQPLLELVRTTQCEGARILWGSFDDEVALINELTAEVIASCDPAHSVADVHRRLPIPDDPCHAMVHRLITLRYVRQHDHMAAWSQEGLTASEMSALTELWHGGVVDESDGLTAVVDRGLASPDQMLTATGQELRDQIEAETNRRNAESFAVLGDDGCRQLLASLRAVPPT